MKHILFTFLLSSLVLSCFGQEKLNKTIAEADAYYKNGKYHKAIPLYQEAITLNRDSDLSLNTKLAYSFRMLNQMNVAEALYAKIVKDDKAETITYYYYAEALMSNGKYDAAKKWFLKYGTKEPNDTRATTMATACEKAKNLTPIFSDITVNRMTFNTSSDDYAPMYYHDGLIFVSDYLEEDKAYMEDGSTERSFSSIYYARTDSAEIYSDEPLPFSKKFNKQAKNSGPSSISGNHKYFFFSRNNKVSDKNSNQSTMAIYIAERTVDGWKTPEILPFCDENYNFIHPAASYSGDTLYFVSDKPNGFGATDIYVTYRQRTKKRNKKGALETIEQWVSPTNIGAGVNTVGKEAFPYLSIDGKLYFSSNGHPGFGGYDLFEASLNEEFIFENTINLGSNFNSPKDDMSIIFDSEKRTGYFASNRLSGSDDDIFSFRNGQKQIIIHGEIMNAKTKKYIGQSKITLKSSEDEYVDFSDYKGNFNLKIKTGKLYTLLVEKQGFTPYKYQFDATTLVDGEMIPFLIRLHSSKSSIAQQPEDILKQDINPNDYLPTSIPARDFVAKQVETVINNTQLKYKNKNANTVQSSAPKFISNQNDVEPMPEVMPETVPEMMPETTPKTKPKKTKKSKDKITPKNYVPTPSKPSKMEAAEMNIVNNQEVSSNENSDDSKANMLMGLQVMNENNQPIHEAILQLMNEKGQLLETIYTDVNGHIELLLKPKSTYLLKLNHKDFISKTIIIDTETESEPLNETVSMKSKTEMANYTFKSLSFEKGEFELKERAKIELDRVAYILNKNPNLTIEIVGFTDALGDFSYNQKLSEQRAMQAATYLIRKGIKPTRIILKNKGESELLNGCKDGINCSEKLHQVNRRVTIKVVN